MANHLLVTNDFPPKTGGIQVYLYELWSRFEPDRAVVLTSSSHPESAKFDAASDLTIERVSAPTLFLPTLRARRAIEAAIERHRPSLVLFDPAWPLALLGPSLSVPYGVVLHGAEVTIPGRLPVLASSLRRVLSRASVVVCAGRYPELEARRCAGDLLGPVLNVAPGVDTMRFHPLDTESRAEARSHFGFSPDEVVVASYSRLVPRKGFDVLIRAASELSSLVPGLRVVIGGTGRDEGRLKKLIRKTGAPVTMLGRVSDEDLPRLLGASDLFVMNCRRRWGGLEQEGFGIVFAEAQAAGLAVVAGHSGGSDEAVRDAVTGVVVQSTRDAHALTRVIDNLLRDDELRESYAAAARQFVVERFDWDLLAASLAEGLAPFDGGPPALR